MEEEQNISETLQKQKTNFFTEVTPLSKFLAMALFIALPFVGFWFGYKYAPEKVVEVEKIVLKEFDVDNNLLDGKEKLTPAEYVLIHNSCTNDSDCVIVRKGFGCCSDGMSINKDNLSNYLNYFSVDIEEEESYCEMEYERGLSCGAQRYNTRGYQPVCVEKKCVIKDMVKESVLK